MQINKPEVKITEKNNGLVFNSKKPLYVLANRSGFDFKNVTEFDNHYLNNSELEPVIKSANGITVVATVELIKDKFYTNVSMFFDAELDNISIINLYRTIIETISTSSWDVDAINKDELDNELGNFYNTIFIACTGKSEKELPFDISLFYDAKDLLDKTLREALDKLGYPKDVIKYMESMGVTIDSMVDAGMAMVVGVDDQTEDEIREQLRKQIFHALEDINVISYLVAAIRLEEDYEHHRIRGINVDDDPAYLYMDEIMGMAIANQIAGTKAIFNFKRYDEAKPGVLGVLGPSVDDIIGGLIAGCMSKIFEP